MRAILLTILFALIPKPAHAQIIPPPSKLIQSDAYCYFDQDLKVPAGVITARTTVEIQSEKDDLVQVYSNRHKTYCWVSANAFLDPNYIYAEDLARTLKWRTLVQRWLPYFPNLTEELVLSIIYKETKGNPHAVDQTGNDIRLVGEASVGVMGAIPRKHLPCYAELTGPNGRDEYSCQIYLGSYILNSAIQQALELRVGKIRPEVVIAGTVLFDVSCTKNIGGVSLGWLTQGTEIEGIQTARNDLGETAYVKVYSEKHDRYCWIPLDSLEQGEVEPAPPQDLTVTQEDIELGLMLYGCTLENVLSDSCLSWGGRTYVDLVVGLIMPEIIDAIYPGGGVGGGTSGTRVGGLGR